MKKNGCFKKLSFILIISLVCTLMPFGHGHETVYAAEWTAAQAKKYLINMGYFTEATHKTTAAFQKAYPTDDSGVAIGYTTLCKCGGGYREYLMTTEYASKPTKCGENLKVYVGCMGVLNSSQVSACVKHTVTITTEHIPDGEAYVKDDGYWWTDCKNPNCDGIKGKKATCKITFKGGGGETSSSKTSYTQTGFKKNDNLKALAFTRYGYTFAGWDDGSGKPYIGDGVKYNKFDVNGMTLTAKWTAKKPKVTFDAQGGSVDTTSKTVTYNKTYGTLPTPTKTGSTFDGWYLEDIFDTKVTEDTKVENPSKHTLFAKWIEIPYTVTYNGMGGTVSQETAVLTYGKPVDLSVTAAHPTLSFAGWTLDTSKNKLLSEYTMPANDITLYAVYSIPVSDIKDVKLYVWSDNITFSDMLTFDISKIAEDGMIYTYSLLDLDISSVVDNVNTTGNELRWSVRAIDNAGNYTTWNSSDTPPPPEKEKKTQIIKHIQYDREEQTYKSAFKSCSHDVMEGETFIPHYCYECTTDGCEIPEGYMIESIDQPYTVVDTQVVYARYTPCQYTVFFNVNLEGATVEPTSKQIFYMDRYGDLPVPVKEGYDFEYWYDPLSGEPVKSSDKHNIAGDRTLYAQWKVKSYCVEYNYDENGGTYADKEIDYVDYGEVVDLTVDTGKPGWEKIGCGWSLGNPDATEDTKSVIMPAHNITLYGIYKKDIKATFVDVTNTTVKPFTLYNKKESEFVEIIPQGGLVGWSGNNWTTQTEPNASGKYSVGATLELSDDITLYSLYTKDIEICYETGIDGVDIGNSQGRCYLNACDPNNVLAAEIPLPGELMKENASFVVWKDLTSKVEYEPLKTYEFVDSTTLTAIWDMYPEIEAYDRYFTLDEALDGKITEGVLLEKVKATDFEDGTLENGTDVVIKNYDSSIFKSEPEVNITYQATDSFGNKVEQTITVYVVDTTLKKIPLLFYSRFISKDFYSNEEGLIPFNLGGLESTSVWRTDETYSRILEKSMFNKKLNEEYKIIDTFGSNIEVKIAGSGEWEHTEETWVFSKEDIEDVKKFVNEHGYGNIKEPGAIDLFYEKFGRCRQ